MSLNFSVDDKEVREALDRLIDSVKNPKKALKAIGAYVRASTQLRFRNSIKPDGSPWAPVKRGGKPLVDTGRLRDSITYEVGETFVDIGTNVVYAPYCQFGTKPHEIKAKPGSGLFWPGARHPMKSVQHPGTEAREYLGFNDEDKQETLNLINDFLKAAAEGK